MLSRVADSLYWVGRYLERAEHTARLIDVNLVLMLDQSPTFAQQRWRQVLSNLILSEPAGELNITDLSYGLAFRTDRSSLRLAIGAARDNARQVREQISTEMWEQLNRLYLQLNQSLDKEKWEDEPHPLLRSIIEGVHLFHGITDGTLAHGEGWQWLQLGRFIERASASCRLLETHFSSYFASRNSSEGVIEYLDWVSLLKSCTAFEAYCQVYTADLQPEQIAEFLLLNQDFPRSIRFASVMVRDSLNMIASETSARKAPQVDRLAGRLHAMLDYGQIDEIMSDDMLAYLRDIQKQCGQIHAMVSKTYFTPPLEAVLNI